MSYAESYNESGRRRSSSSTRGGRPFYISPHLRNNNNDDVSFIVTIPARPNPAWFSSGSSNRYNRYDRASPSYRPGYGYGRGRFGGQPRELDIEGSSSGYPFDEQEIPDDGGINFDAYEDIPVETIGQDVPPPVDSFSEFDFGKVLGDNIQRCNYVRPTPIQRHAIPVVMAGRDLMACAQTGSGKTAAFCFPIISGILRDQSLRSFSREMTAYPLALILSPTRELCCQIHEEAKKFSYQTGVKVVVAYGGAPMYQQLRDLEKGVDILVATPGRLVDMIERERVSLSKIKYLALDEADRMLDMGFEPQIRQIVQRMGMPPPGSRQTMLFSATFPNDIKALASDFLSNYIFLSVGRVGSSTDLITQKVVYVYDTDKRNCLLNLLREQKAIGNHGKHALILVFVETKRGADALEHWLSTKGFPAAVIHGDKVQMERENALKSFKTGRTPILVATDVAARGLDIPHVAHVINYDLPKSIDDYVHRIGRTGRAGKSGSATAFFSDKNALLAKSLADLMRESKQEVPSWLTNYAQQSSYPSGSSGGGSGGRGGGGGGGRYYGGGRYGGGGRDYQYENNYRGGNYNNNRSGQYGYSNAIPIYDAPSPPSYDYSASPRPDSNTVEFDEGWN